MGSKYVKENETFNTNRNGVVPKPTSQEVSDNKYLRADGQWKTPPGGGGGGGSTVEIEPTLSEGTKVADFEIDGTPGSIYAPTPPTKTSDLNNDSNFISDNNYTHTDNNYTNTEKTKLSNIEAGAEVNDVSDVKVNGTSVVDANKVAKIVSYKEVTRAEYDALPASKNSDGILYAIKNEAGAKGDRYMPEIYSTEEREIGVWTDGKPLYEKTVNGSFTDGETSLTLHITNNMGLILNLRGFIIPSDNPGNTVSLETRNQYVWVQDGTSGNGNVTIQRVGGASFGSTPQAYITACYTKITDTPGSGTWTTQGAYAHHYDGNEKIIGTWFGDTLYEKTIYYQSPGGQADSDVIIDNTILHGTNCLVVDISGVQTYGYLDGSHPDAFSDPEPLSQNTLYLPFYGGATAPSGQIYLYSDGIHFMKKMAASNANGIILTVRYIKILN